MNIWLIYGILVGLLIMVFLRVKWRREFRKEQSEAQNREFRRKMNFSNEYQQVRNRVNQNLGEIDPGPKPKISYQFMYNGHAWDACEVLGLSPDFSAEELHQAYERCLQGEAVESEEFFRHAYDTLVNFK
ncbi:MAG: hypothetical protein HOO06_12540 [Bdellovibrionaceae bacterium]|jgi:hypothetical protein|nr:hypothetical protein [Pseudobdellovibrionaceae bacterium]